MRRILCLDDDEEFCNYLEAFFDFPETHFVKVHNIAAANKIIAKENFDAILLDFELPDGTGIDIARRIRKDANNRTILSLITSRKISMNEYLMLKRDLKINFVMTKPLLPTSATVFARDLLEKVQEAKKEAAAHREHI